MNDINKAKTSLKVHHTFQQHHGFCQRDIITELIQVKPSEQREDSEEQTNVSKAQKIQYLLSFTLVIKFISKSVIIRLAVLKL